MSRSAFAARSENDRLPSADGVIIYERWVAASPFLQPLLSRMLAAWMTHWPSSNMRKSVE
jgi:hypothetical protein